MLSSRRRKASSVCDIDPAAVEEGDAGALGRPVTQPANTSVHWSCDEPAPVSSPMDRSATLVTLTSSSAP
jgi:hypothetical protein